MVRDGPGQYSLNRGPFIWGPRSRVKIVNTSYRVPTLRETTPRSLSITPRKTRPKMPRSDILFAYLYSIVCRHKNSPYRYTQQQLISCSLNQQKGLRTGLRAGSRKRHSQKENAASKSCYRHTLTATAPPTGQSGE